MNWLKLSFLAAAQTLGGFALSQRQFRDQARILAYHGVDSLQDPVINYDGFQVHPNVFRRQLEILRRKFHVYPLRELVAALRDGKGLGPEAVAITFDDGYLNNLTVAATLLQENGFHATFFVTTGYVTGSHKPWWYTLRESVARATVPAIDIVGQPLTPIKTADEKCRAIGHLETRLKTVSAKERDTIVASVVRLCRAEEGAPKYPMMNGADIRKLMAMGFDIGAHTVSHPSLAHEPGDEGHAEIAGSVAWVERETGRRPLLYSYPYGGDVHVTEEVKSSVRAAGCLGAVTTREGMIGRDADPFMLKRLNISGRHGPLAFESLVSGFTILLGRGKDRAG